MISPVIDFGWFEGANNPLDLRDAPAVAGRRRARS